MVDTTVHVTSDEAVAILVTIFVYCSTDGTLTLFLIRQTWHAERVLVESLNCFFVRMISFYVWVRCCLTHYSLVCHVMTCSFVFQGCLVFFDYQAIASPEMM